MFRTREQLLEWLEMNPPTKIVGKAILEGSVELYGLFYDAIGNQSAWIVHVASPRGREWDVAVGYINNRRPYSGLLKRVPWGRWVGHDYSNKLCKGDYPELYMQRKANYDLRSSYY